MADTEQIRQQVKSPAPLSTWFGVVLLLFLFGAMAVAIIGPAPRGDTYEQEKACTCWTDRNARPRGFRTAVRCSCGESRASYFATRSRHAKTNFCHGTEI